MNEIEIEGKLYRYQQKVLALSDVDLFSWIENHEVFPKVFWKERTSSTAYAAIGALLSFEHIPDLSSCSADLRFYGGLCFDPLANKDPLWRDFPAKRFWLPQWEIIQRDDQTQLVMHTLSESMEWESCEKGPCIREIRAETPNFQQWNDNMERFFAEERLQKVVLARRLSLDWEKTRSGWELLRELQNRSMQTTLFGFALHKESLFLGATPEMLFVREGTCLKSDAVAGTRARGTSLEEDARKRKDLLKHTKDLEEFLIVKDFLTATLSDYTTSLQWEEKDRILQNSHVQHLYNQLQAVLNKGVTDEELIHKLHPTPALGGFPREEALAFIRCHEPFDRGWYGGVVGQISSTNTHLAVAIRSALICDDQIHLFSGAGIVQESDPLQEWEELNQKIQPFLKGAMAHG